MLDSVSNNYKRYAWSFLRQTGFVHAKWEQLTPQNEQSKLKKEKHFPHDTKYQNINQDIQNMLPPWLVAGK